MRVRFATAFGCGFLLAACAPGHEWYKPGAGPDQVMSDVSDCRFQADKRVQSDYAGRMFELDSRARVAIDPGRQSELRHEFENQRMAKAAHANRLASDCMEARGYVVRSVAPP